MRQIRCLAVDDEPMALEKLANYIGRLPFLELVALCESPIEAMEVLMSQPVDALFIDINMPDLNGLEFVSSLPEQPMVVFTTAYAEYAVESYRVSAVDYLLKPFDFAGFQRAATRLLKQCTSSVQQPARQETCLFVKDGYKYVNINIADILYAKAMSDYVRLYLNDGNSVITNITMKLLKEKLPGHFLQVHRSYIVNMNQVREIERCSIVLDESTRIAVGENYKKDFLNYLRAHSLEKNLLPDKMADEADLSLEKQ